MFGDAVHKCKGSGVCDAIAADRLGATLSLVAAGPRSLPYRNPKRKREEDVAALSLALSRFRFRWVRV
jgi:hypothetical protein